MKRSTHRRVAAWKENFVNGTRSKNSRKRFAVYQKERAPKPSANYDIHLAERLLGARSKIQFTIL